MLRPTVNRPKQILLFVLLACALPAAPALSGTPGGGKRIEPTFANVASGPHAMDRIDFWKAESDKPTPLVIVFHGGGFRRGDKSIIQGWKFLGGYLPKGVSFASVDYPLLQHTGPDYLEIMKHCRTSVEFLEAQSAKWNIDPKRIALFGSSAGALIAEWLGCTMPGISAVGAYQQPLGTTELVVPYLKQGCPPFYIFQSSGALDLLHSSMNATLLKTACDAKRIECELWGNQKNGFARLPDGRFPTDHMMDFCFRIWRSIPAPAAPVHNGKSPDAAGRNPGAERGAS